MIEFLAKNENGEYFSFNSEYPKSDEWIEVPDGAIKLTIDTSKTMTFWKSNVESMNVGQDKEWVSAKKDEVLTFSKYSQYDYDVLWQREKVDVGVGNVSEKLSKVDETLKERQSRYGDFTSVANTTGQLMGVIKNSKNGLVLPYAHEEALHMICSKIARVMNGDFNHKDSWHDIGGYAKLIEDLIGDNS